MSRRLFLPFTFAFGKNRRVFLISTLALDRMAKTTTKRFSNVRYWRYIFTPLIFLIVAISLFIVFTSDVAMTAPLNALTTSYRKNTMNLLPAGTNLGSK